MAKAWYPVINYEECVECGTCVEFCSHGVYNKEKSPRPVVVNTEGCIQGCKGCGSLCPSGAIEYFGDNTGCGADACGCNCGSGNNGGCGCNCGGEE